MLTILFFLCFFGTTMGALRGFVDTSDVTSENHWLEFNNFIATFNKKYETFEEFDTRFGIFQKNLLAIFEHNRKIGQNFTLGINQFTDLTPQEFKALYIGQGVQSLGGCTSFSSNGSVAPAALDWRDKGKVNAVRNQGQCGSCWAFATTANAESVWAIATNNLYDLSEQYLVDCDSLNMGCNGGNPDLAFKFMINKGQCTDFSYPYTSGVTKTAGTCQSSCTKSPVAFTSCSDVKSKDQVSLKGALAMKPVVVAIEADTAYFQSYSSGILTSSIQCGTNLDHAVEIIGYGEENGIKYWTVRNSWGVTWGEEGYVRIERSDSTNDIGVCGIAAQPSFLNV